jgi:hypothetical protein
MEYSKPNLHNLNKKANYYRSSPSPSRPVISKKLKQENTLEQDMVNKMLAKTNVESRKLSPRYQPLLPNSAGASLVE